jgi:hypothetical protein
MNKISLKLTYDELCTLVNIIDIHSQLCIFLNTDSQKVVLAVLHALRLRVFVKTIMKFERPKSIGFTIAEAYSLKILLASKAIYDTEFDNYTFAVIKSIQLNLCKKLP